jgi:hypothetical protein
MTTISYDGVHFRDQLMKELTHWTEHVLSINPNYKYYHPYLHRWIDLSEDPLNEDNFIPWWEVGLILLTRLYYIKETIEYEQSFDWMNSLAEQNKTIWPELNGKFPQEMKTLLGFDDVNTLPIPITLDFDYWSFYITL